MWGQVIAGWSHHSSVPRNCAYVQGHHGAEARQSQGSRLGRTPTHFTVAEDPKVDSVWAPLRNVIEPCQRTSQLRSTLELQPAGDTLEIHAFRRPLENRAVGLLKGDREPTRRGCIGAYAADRNPRVLS